MPGSGPGGQGSEPASRAQWDHKLSNPTATAPHRVVGDGMGVSSVLGHLRLPKGGGESCPQMAEEEEICSSRGVGRLRRRDRV